MYDLSLIPHCWGYHRLLTWQLSGFVQFPPKPKVLYRPCVTAEDKDTIRVLEWFAPRLPSTVTLLPLYMEKRYLVRRAYGRSQTGHECTSPILGWIDADYIYGPGDCEAIINAFPAGAKLAHPAKVRATSWPDGMAMIESVKEPKVMEIDLKIFNQTKKMRAIGGVQFVPRDIALLGYCDDELGGRRMGPADRWQRTKEDRKLRLKLGEDQPMPITALYRVRHDVRSEGNAVDVRL